MKQSIIFLFLAFAETVAFAQLNSSFRAAEMQNCFRPETPKTTYDIAKNNRNEWQYLFSGLFLFYKYAFSSQDDNRCNFHPSCSEYGMIAVKKHGTLLGMLATVDRLQRCNGLSPELYQIDIRRKLLIDQP
jgi:putative component of membrane protein insertase Oxa1/YidC/SpoIIIJ protein YidD